MNSSGHMSESSTAVSPMAPSSSSSSSVIRHVFDLVDLVRCITVFIPIEDLLEEAQFVNRSFYTATLQILGEINARPSFQHLTCRTSAVFPNAKTLCKRIVSNRQHLAGGFVLLGGSFGSYDTRTYWVRDNPNRFEGVELPDFQAFSFFGSSSILLDPYGDLRSFGGWNETISTPDSIAVGFRSFSFYEWARRMQPHTTAYRRRHLPPPPPSNTAIATASTDDDSDGDGDGDRQWTWMQSASQLPQPRCYTAACASSDGGRVFVLGGCSSPYRNARIYSSCLVGHLAPPVRPWLASTTAAAAAAANRALETEDLRWQDAAIAPMRVPRGGHGVVSLPQQNDNLFVVGGYGGGLQYHRSAELWDWAAMRWLPLPDMHECRSGMALALGTDGAVYVAGGSSDGTIGHRSLERYDPREGRRWQKLADMACPRGYIAGAMGGNGVQGGHFYVTGGLHAGQLHGGLEYYDARRNAWALVPGSTSAAHSTEEAIADTVDFAVYPPETQTQDEAEEEEEEEKEAEEEEVPSRWFTGPAMAREGLLRAGFQMIYAL